MIKLILAIAFFPILLTAQTVPDFEVTDSEGNTHRLYQDYLDLDKTVVLDIFFTTCPPCRSIAASTEIFYQQWGAGMHDVEFFEMSNKSFDTDVLVNAYKAEFGITYPSVGQEGGSLTALAPYLAGQFGNFYGTPTFIVIAPDGTYDWDVGGSDLWEALDASIYATGAIKPGDVPNDTTDVPNDTIVVSDPGPVSINGKIHRFSSENDGIAFAEVIVTTDQGVEITRYTTDLSGEYAFVLDSTLVADNILTMHVEKYTSPTNGVSATDLLLIQKHLLGLTPFESNEKIFAGDGNGSLSLSALDLVEIRKLLLGLIDHFGDEKSWLFFPADSNLGTPQDPPQDPPVLLDLGPVLISEMIDGSASTNFKGIKRGDVNESAKSSE